QYNKQDLPKELTLPVPELSDAINFRNVPEFAADALHGPGGFETLRGISEIVLRRLSAAGSQPAAAGRKLRMQGQPRSRFDNYVVGSANRLAVAAPRAIAESPAGVATP